MWVADYVLMEYGTGAIMAVPAHDERDFAFADAFGLRDPARGRRAATTSCRTPATGAIVNSARASTAWTTARRSTRSSTGWRARAAVTARSTTGCATGWSRASATGAARSRSSTATSCGIVPVPEDQLPVVLPDVADYAPKGTLAARRRRGVGATRRARAAAGRRERETDTMDTFVDSSWYFLRYCDADNDEAALGAEASPSGCPSTSTSAASSTRSCT